MGILVLCEKREQGEKVAQGLGLSAGRGRFHGRWKGVEMVLVWAAGHLFEPEEPQAAKPDANWHDPASLLPLPEKVGLKPSERGKKLLGGLKREIRAAREVWIATDPDREGEAIARDILEHAGFRGVLKRMWLGDSLEPSDVKKAAEKLLPGEQHLPDYRAQQARRSSDWYWQFLVRNYTAAARCGMLGPELAEGRGRAGVVSLGRVQSATLRLIVERDLAIERHSTIEHYGVSATLSGLEMVYAPEAPIPPQKGVHVDDDGKALLTDKKAVSALSARLERGGKALVERVERRRAKRAAPNPHSLTTLQRICSRKYGLSARETLKIADQLRLDGYLTYPRTEHGELPLSLYNREDFERILPACFAIEELTTPARQAFANHANEDFSTPPRCFVKKPMEHHGIIPTGKRPNLAGWERKQRQVFIECARAFVVALYPEAVYDTLSVIAHADTEDALGRERTRLTGNARALLIPGWLAALGEPEEASHALPELTEGEAYPLEAVTLKTARTRPPKPFTEDTLLGAMKAAGSHAEGEDAKILNKVSGIGTPATRDTVIETLFTRNYTRREGKTIRSTPRGRALIARVPEDLANVSLTADLERSLNAIAQAKSDAEARRMRDAFIAEQSQFVTRHIKETIDTMSQHPAENAPCNPPTAKMLSAARKISHSRNIDLPEDAERSFEACRAFLDEVMSQPAPPTPKMRELAQKIERETHIALDGALETFEACKAYIDAHLPKLKRCNPPTEKMLAAARAVAKRHGVDVPADAEKSFDACREFLNDYPRK